MGNSLVLRSADGSTQLIASVGGTDAMLELVHRGVQRRSLRFDLSRLLPVSTTRPWAFRPQSFQSVSATERDGTLSLIGRNTCFETSVRLRFDGPVLSLDLHWACIAPDPSFVFDGKRGCSTCASCGALDHARQSNTMPMVSWRRFVARS